MSESQCPKTIREGWEMSQKYRQLPPPDSTAGAIFPMGIPPGWEINCDKDSHSGNDVNKQKAVVKFYEKDGLIIMSKEQFDRFKNTGVCNG